MEYVDGDMMADSGLYCASKAHPDCEFFCVVEWGMAETHGAQVFQLTFRTTPRRRVWWIFYPYGTIPARTLTYGEQFSPYDNRRLPWLNPDFSDWRSLPARLEALT